MKYIDCYLLKVYFSTTHAIFSFSYRLTELGARRDEAQTDSELTQHRHYDSTRIECFDVVYIIKN